MHKAASKMRASKCYLQNTQPAKTIHKHLKPSKTSKNLQKPPYIRHDYPNQPKPPKNSNNNKKSTTTHSHPQLLQTNQNYPQPFKPAKVIHTLQKPAKTLPQPPKTLHKSLSQFKATLNPL